MSSIMALASMSKVLTTIAALQLVEKRLVDLETDVSSLTPTLASQGILQGLDAAGRPRYDMSNPDLARFKAYRGRNINSGSTIGERFGYPLTFEPDTAWKYGTGIDWVGQLLELLTGQTL
ncbi:acyltransferase LovD [Aspergillus awamori]|uniref:Acyltransferase LovD n=1 Tax=Aspergillus awamori TaxID=105351 RepID=A0A401L7H1_ASPAW|nr:acyltransferase LovD [Aspergillus awamori]